MIDLSQPALHVEGVTVFADHADPRLFHYLPDRPRLRTALDGIPDLRLIEYRLDSDAVGIQGGGILSVTVDLNVDADVLARATAKVSQKLALGSAAQLSPVVAESGKCELIALDKDPAAPAGSSILVEKVLGGSQPALYGDEAATFWVVLSPEGATLVEAALRHGELPAGVVYSLQVLALRPALRAAITARWQDAYTYYENRLHGGKMLLAVDVGVTTEELIASQVLTVQIDDLLPPEERDGAYRSAVDQAQRYVLEELFKPTLGTQPPPADDGDGAQLIGKAVKDLLGFFAFTYTLREVDRTELKTMTYRLDAASAERLTLAPQGVLSDLLLKPDGSAVDPALLIQRVEGGPSPRMRFQVVAAIDLAGDGIDRVEVQLRYGDHRTVLLLQEASPRGEAIFFRDGQLGNGIACSYEVYFRPDGTSPEVVLRSPEVSTEERVVLIDPRDLYQRVSVTLVAAGIPWDRFLQVIADVTAAVPGGAWSFSQTLLLDSAHQQAAFRVRAPLGAAVRLRRRLRYVDADGKETLRDWDTVEPGISLVLSPFPASLDVRIAASARFGTEVARILVELRPTAHPEQVATRVLTADAPFATWSLALADPADLASRAFEYRVTIHTVRAEVREGIWVAGPPDGGTLVVGERYPRRSVQLQFLGKPLAVLGLIAVKVRFDFDDPEADIHAEDEILVQDLSRPVSWQYPVADPQRAAYRYQLTLVHANGTLEARDRVTTSDLLVAVPLV